MRISIEKVYPIESILSENNAAPRFWVDFSSEMVSGQAIFVPANANADQLRGANFCVETDFKDLRDYQILPKERRQPVSMKSLDKPGNYEVVAEVKSVMPLGDEVNGVIVEAKAGGALFTLTSDEIGGQVPEVGDVIYFKLVELLLWDENI